MRPTRWRWVAVLCVAAGLPAATGASTLDRAWAVGPRPVVILTSNRARLRVRAERDGIVRISLKHIVRIRGDRYEPYTPVVAMNRTGDTLHVSATTGGATAEIGAGGEWFELLLRVPAGCELTASTGEGDVDVKGVRGAFAIEARHGDVRARAVQGNLQVTTRFGGAVRVTGFDGALEAAALREGDVSVAGRFDALRLRGAHRIDADVKPGSRLASPWLLQGVPDPDREVPGEAGALTVHLPGDLAARLEARSGVGALHCELPSARFDSLDAHVGLARLGDGTALLQVLGGTGPVRVLAVQRSGDRSP